jgi:hypothetical protein
MEVGDTHNSQFTGPDCVISTARSSEA